MAQAWGDCGVRDPRLSHLGKRVSLMPLTNAADGERIWTNRSIANRRPRVPAWRDDCSGDPFAGKRRPLPYAFQPAGRARRDRSRHRFGPFFLSIAIFSRVAPGCSLSALAPEGARPASGTRQPLPAGDLHGDGRPAARRSPGQAGFIHGDLHSWELRFRRICLYEDKQRNAQPAAGLSALTPPEVSSFSWIISCSSSSMALLLGRFMD